MIFGKKLQVALNEKQRLIEELTKKNSELQLEFDAQRKSFINLQEKYDELIKRKDNLAELVMAFRDMEIDTGVIKITRINPEDIFLRGRR